MERGQVLSKGSKGSEEKGGEEGSKRRSRKREVPLKQS